MAMRRMVSRTRPLRDSLDGGYAIDAPSGAYHHIHCTNTIQSIAAIIPATAGREPAIAFAQSRVEIKMAVGSEAADSMALALVRRSCIEDLSAARRGDYRAG